MPTAPRGSRPPWPVCPPRRGSGGRSRASGRPTRSSSTAPTPRPMRRRVSAMSPPSPIPSSSPMTRRSGRGASTTTATRSSPPSPPSRPSAPTPSCSCADCPRRPGVAWGGTRDRAATPRKTGWPSTPSTWKSTRARSTPTSPPGARVRGGLLDGRHLRVEDAEDRLDEEKAPLGTLEVVDSAGPYFQVEGCPPVHHRYPAPPGVDAPLHDHGRVGFDADVDELEGAAPEPDRPAPLARDVADGRDRFLGRQRGAPGEEEGDQRDPRGGAGRPSGDHRGGLCQMTCPTKNGPRLAMYSEVWAVFRMAWTRWESGCSSLPTRPIRKSLSWTSRPWHTRRTSCARSASPYARPMVPCSRRMAPCSCADSLAKAPVRRRGYQMAQGHAGLSTVRRGRRRSQSSRSDSKPLAYVRPSMASSGLWVRAAKGSAPRISRWRVAKKAGSSAKVSTPTPRGSWRSA